MKHSTPKKVEAIRKGTGRHSKRPQFFAIKFCRILANTQAASEIGADACWLLTVVVQQEDAIHYRRPVTFWNNQLQGLCGFGSPRRLRKARDAAIVAGWLEYEAGTKHIAGRYRVTFPSGYGLKDEYIRGADLNQQSNFPGAESVSDQHLERPLNDTSTSISTSISFKPKPNPNPSPKPIGNTADKSAAFDQFWDLFPKQKRTNKESARKAFEKSVKSVAPQTIIDSAAEYAASEVGKTKYAQSATTWLSGGCWDDDRAAWNQSQNIACVGVRSMEVLL